MLRKTSPHHQLLRIPPFPIPNPYQIQTLWQMRHLNFMKLACWLRPVQQPARWAVKLNLCLCKRCVFGQLQPGFGGGRVGVQLNACLVVFPYRSCVLYFHYQISVSPFRSQSTSMPQVRVVAPSRNGGQKHMHGKQAVVHLVPGIWSIQFRLRRQQLQDYRMGAGSDYVANHGAVP